MSYCFVLPNGNFERERVQSHLIAQSNQRLEPKYLLVEAVNLLPHVIHPCGKPGTGGSLALSRRRWPSLHLIHGIENVVPSSSHSPSVWSDQWRHTVVGKARRSGKSRRRRSYGIRVGVMCRLFVRLRDAIAQWYHSDVKMGSRGGRKSNQLQDRRMRHGGNFSFQFMITCSSRGSPSHAAWL